MRPAGPARTLALGIVWLALVASRAGAQGELQSWLDPELGELKPRGDYRLTHYPDRPVDGQPTDLGIVEHSVTFTVPLHQNAHNEWSLIGDARLVDFDTRAILPDTREPFPGELWDVSGGVSYRHKFQNGWIGAANLTVGSVSDDPFASFDEMIVRAFGMLRVPHRERNAWVFSLIYTSDEEFLGGLPIPGLAYEYVHSERLNAVIGVPFTSVEYKPLDKLTLEGQYFPIRRFRTRATYEMFRPLRLFVGFDWDNDHYFRADRDDEDDRLYYYEKRALGGVRFDLRHVGFQCEAATPSTASTSRARTTRTAVRTGSTSTPVRSPPSAWPSASERAAPVRSARWQSGDRRRRC
jgi:hypothetical protein